MAKAIADTWLPQTEAPLQTLPLEHTILRHTLACGAIALPTIPFCLSLVASPAFALPAGVGLVAALCLVVPLAAISLVRKSAASVPMAEVTIRDNSMLDLMPGLVLLHDSRGHVLEQRGRDCIAMLADLRSPLGRGFIDQIHVSDQIRFLQAVDLLRQGENQTTLELRLERQQMLNEASQFLHVRMQMTAERDAHGQLTGIVSQIADMNVEDSLRADASSKSQEAESANEAKTRFLAAVSHELRTPLNAILGFSDILRGGYFGELQNDRQKEYVELIFQSGTHLLAVVNTMLDMSKIETGRYELVLEPFSVAETVHTCESMLDLQAKTKGVVLTSRVSRAVRDVVADQRAIQQILINLVGNAIKFTDKGGVVTIDAGIDGDSLKLSVSDTGIGIAADKLAILGQPFMQIENALARKYEGTGLGLSLVKGLARLHGGCLQVESEPGRGSVFSVLVPLNGLAVEEGDNGQAEEQSFAFPPRLRSAATTALHTDEDWLDDDAQAKTA